MTQDDQTRHKAEQAPDGVSLDLQPSLRVPLSRLAGSTEAGAVMAKAFKDKVLRQCAQSIATILQGVRMSEATRLALEAQWGVFDARVRELEEGSEALEKRRAADRERSRRRG